MSQLANAHVRRWLDEVANARVHATTKAVPAMRLAEERAVMLPAPALEGAAPRCRQRVALAGGEPAASAGGLRRAAGGARMSLQHERIAALCEQLKLARLAATGRPSRRTRRAMKPASPTSWRRCSPARLVARDERQRHDADASWRRCPAIKTLEQFDWSHAERRAEGADPGARAPGVRRARRERRAARARAASARPTSRWRWATAR